MIPEQLKQLKFCRVRKQSKSPFEKDWTNKLYSYKEISKFKNENYGVLCGQKDLAVIDCDEDALSLAVSQLLPETFSVKTGGGGMHFYYFIPELKKKMILNTGDEHLGEIQSYGTQVVGAGSTHPNGNEYEVVDNVEIKEISLEDLKKVLGKFMQEEIKYEIEGKDIKDYEKLVDEIVKVWKEGDRQELALSVSGYLRKEKRLGANKVQEIIKKVCEITKDKEVKMRLRAVIETFKKDESKIKGYTGLKKLNLEKKELKKKNYISSYIDKENKIIVEQIYEKNSGSLLCIYNHNTKKIEYTKEWKHNGKIFVSQEGEELEKNAILLPSKAEDYNEEELNKQIKDFIHKWLDVPEDVSKFGVWNTKRSWVYDVFHTLNYLRALGDTGMGKSRYLNTFGCIHYKPIFTSGATTTAPLFRIIDKWRGTLVMDEADLKYSDESADTIKIINQGFEKNSFIMRCDQIDATKIKFFDPYCPKILATRRPFEDKATESRCITHVMEVTERKDIPVNLNDEFFEEAQKIRNKLLMWRFKNYFEIDLNKKFDLGDLEPRVEQIVSSYISLFSGDEKQMEDFKDYIKNYQEDLIEERQSSFEGNIIGVIHSLLRNLEKDFDAKRIIEKGEFTNRLGKPMQPRALSSYLKSLGFKKSNVLKVDGKTKRCISIEPKHITKLFERYGYEVTEVTVVTGSPQLIKIGVKEEKGQKDKTDGANRIHRNDSNSVTTKDKKKNNLNENNSQLNAKAGGKTDGI